MPPAEKDKDSAPVVEWGTVDWGESTRDPAAAEKASRGEPEEVAPSEAPRKARPPQLAREVPDDAPDSDESLGVATAVGGARATETAGSRLIFRGLLMLIAAGYLSVVATLCYEALGELHREASAASGPRLGELQKSHAQITKLTLGNAAAAGVFALAGLSLLFGWRGFGKLLMFLGGAFLIGFLYMHFKEAQPLLRESDLLYKLIIISVASASLR